MKHQNTRIPPKITVSDDAEIITYDDSPGYKHQYDAFVLYADGDKGFVDQLTSYLANKDFEVIMVLFYSTYFIIHTCTYSLRLLFFS